MAARLGVPAGTVRAWLRRARNNAHTVYRFGVEKVVALNPARLPTTVRPTPLGNALNALVAAANVATDRFGLSVTDPWPLINAISQGRLEAHLIARYVKEYDFYDQAARLVKERLETSLRMSGVRCMVISRAKDVSRLEEKCRQRDRSRHYGGCRRSFVEAGAA